MKKEPYVSDQQKPVRTAESIWDALAAVCQQASVNDADVLEALVLDWLRRTHGPGDAGRLLVQYEEYLAGRVDVPVWRQHSAPPAEAFARTGEARGESTRRLERDRANNH